MRKVQKLFNKLEKCTIVIIASKLQNILNHEIRKMYYWMHRSSQTNNKKNKYQSKVITRTTAEPNRISQRQTIYNTQNQLPNNKKNKYQSTVITRTTAEPNCRFVFTFPTWSVGTFITFTHATSDSLTAFAYIEHAPPAVWQPGQTAILV